MKTTRSTTALDPSCPGFTYLPAGFRVMFLYRGACQDGLDGYAVCRPANQQTVAISMDDLANDDGSPVDWKTVKDFKPKKKESA